MLVLSRRLGESLVIGDNVLVTVVEVTKGKVKLAFTAPRSVTILRAELDPLRNNLPAAEPEKQP